MKLQQLRFIWEVSQRGLNISAAAEALHTSQSGVSKQIRQLEEELGLEIFSRAGKQLVAVTPVGRSIVAMAGRVVAETGNIKSLARDHTDPRRGSLSIATTHTQARYWLPARIRQFIRRYPEVQLHMHQGSPMQIAEMVAGGLVDIAIATEAMEHFENLVMLPLYQWNRSIIVPRDHPLCNVQPLTLEAVAAHPLVTYVFGFTGRSQLDEAFHARRLSPNVVFTATDADVIKTYVRLGLGVGIVAHMAWDPVADADLCALEAGHLFPCSTTKVGFKQGTYLRRYMYDFFELLGPHLTRSAVDAALERKLQSEVDAMFGPDLPVF
jgi:LysR family cys regulon transcriptional activator